MEKIFGCIEKAIENGQDVMLDMITASSGSTPRGAGAKMVVFPDGDTEGTIGGGRAEYLSIQKSVDALKEKRSFTAAYDMSISDVAGTGMICGGNVNVCFKYFSSKDIELVKYINTLLKERRDSWLITRVRKSSVDMGTYDRESGVRFIDGIPDEQAEDWTGRLYSFDYNGDMIYVEPLTRKGTVYIFGAGHVSRELAPLIKHLDFDVVVYEQRKELAEKFPEGIKTVVGDFNDIDSHITMTKDDYAVIMTSGHIGDYDVLEQVLRKELSYTGVIGSRTKVAITRQKLIAAGVEEEKINRLHTPIGLAIKAVTPAEIAVSVAAELILHRAESRKGESK